jgi:DNA polymerase-3 subunit alpha
MVKVEINLTPMGEFELLELLALEKESLGFYVSGHPLDKYRKDLEKIEYTLSSELEDLADGSEALFVGKVENITEKISKKGNKFGIVTLLDLHGNIEIMLFSDKLTQLQQNFDLDEPIAFKVKINKNENFTRMAVLKIESIKEAKKEKIDIIKEIKRDPNPPTIYIYIDLTKDKRVVERLHSVVENNRGYSPLKLILKSEKESILIESQMGVSKDIIDEVKNLGLNIKMVSQTLNH